LATGSTAFLLLIVVTILMSIFNTGGVNGATLTWTYFQVAVVWALFELFLPIAKIREWAPPVATFALLFAAYVCIPPNCGVPKYNLSQNLLNSSPLNPGRLYLSVYPPPESDYRMEKKPHPIGQLIRPGSTSMWAGLRFVNGYSPILPAGVSRDFDFRVHGEINLHEAEYLLWYQSRAGGLLAQIGIDGLVVAWDSGIDPALGPGWELAESTEEGVVYHRVGEPLAHIRSVTSIDSRPNESFTPARISQIDDTRNHVQADVDVQPNAAPALLIFSRPYFRGYQARLGGHPLRVDSYHALFPMVEVPSGAHGQLILIYRPWWLVAGGTVSIICGSIWLLGIFCTTRARY
jgi:hypothetical protein